MRNLVQLLKKFRNFLIFAILQGVFLISFFNSKDYHRSRLVNTSSGIIGWFVEKKHNITKHFSLTEANEKLMEENALLRSQLPETFYPLQASTFVVNDTLKKQQFRYISATVINASESKRHNYFTLNQGSVQGVEVGMGVICSEGIVGKVTDVSDHYSLVMTAITVDSKINVKTSSNNEYWILSWDGSNAEYGQIKDVKRDINLEVGEEIITRGGAGIFPEGIPVGTLSEIIAKDGEQTLSISVELSVNYNAVYHVYIIENIMQKEQLSLEERIPEDE